MPKSGARISVFLLLTLLLGGGFLFWQVSDTHVTSLGGSEFDGVPVRLEIPVLGVDAKMQIVGQDESGRMDIPDNYEDAAWYGLGPRPGEAGNAVVAAHLTTRDLSPAVFARLSELQPGDEVLITDFAARTLRFRVSGKKTYDYRDAVALEEVFGMSDGAHLNLITCDGAWVQSEKNFSERLVVFTDLVE